MKAAAALAEVLARPDVWRADRLASAAIPALASGFAQLDAELPGGGWPRGALTEILADGAGLGECSLLLPVLERMREEGSWSLLVAPPYPLNGTAWAARGIDLALLAVVSPSRPRDALWAAEHALASGALGALLCWATHIDAAQVRRLQVAAGGGGTLAFLLRPLRARSESSAAALRLSLAAAARGRLAVDVLKRRGPPCTRTLDLEVPRPLKWRVNNEFCPSDAGDSALAGSASAASRARSQRPLAVA